MKSMKAKKFNFNKNPPCSVEDKNFEITICMIGSNRRKFQQTYQNFYPRKYTFQIGFQNGVISIPLDRIMRRQSFFR